MKKEKNKDFNILDAIKNTLVDPIKNMESNVKVLDNSKKALLFAGILSVAMMLINLITTMIGSMFVRNCDFWTGKCHTKFTFSPLGNLDYISLIFKYLLMFAIFAFGIAAIYYVIAIILKKNANYIKMLSMTLIAIIPNIVIGMIIGPILGILYGPFNIFANILGSVFTMLILTFSFKNELKFNDIDKLIIYNVICIVILYVLKYFIFIKLIFI